MNFIHPHLFTFVSTLWLFNIAMENHNFLIGKPSINGPFSMAMLVYQREDIQATSDVSKIDKS